MASIINDLFGMFAGRQITKPIFMKDFTKECKQQSDLTKLLSKVTSESTREFIERDVILLKQGMEGENNVYFELKNSFIPMICLHDIRLEYEDYVAQFDFIIITNKFICVLETKKLSGDVEINSDGDFIRTIKNKYGKVIKKEGMYSPISQNERHVKVLKRFLILNKMINRTPIKSAVIMANPKSIINKAKCPKDIDKNIYKYDQIPNLLNRMLTEEKKSDIDNSEKAMILLAEFLMKNNKTLEIDYKAKYGLASADMLDTSVPANVEIKKNSNDAVKAPVEKKNTVPEDNSIVDALRDFRLQISRTEGIKPYMVFNNDEMECLIKVNPKTKEQLLKVPGFGPKKVEKYGEKLLEILKRL